MAIALLFALACALMLATLAASPAFAESSSSSASSSSAATTSSTTAASSSSSTRAVPLKPAPTSTKGDPNAPTLTVFVRDTKSAPAVNIDGMQFTAYKVASLESNGYVLDSTYASTKADFNKEMKADDMLKLAKNMADIAKKKKVKGTNAVSNADGEAKFGKVEQGVYLVVQYGSIGKAKNYSKLDPWMLNVPQKTADGFMYNVVSAPKPGTATKPPTPTPKTGDQTNWSLVAATTALGLIAMMVAILAARKRREH